LNRLSECDEGVVERIRALLLEHLMLCFPGQHLDGDALIRFASQLSGIECADEDVSRLTAKGPMLSGRWDGYKDGHNWHTDKSFTSTPTVATLLSCIATPVVGGDTMFANMYMAYDALSSTMKTILQGLSGLHVRELPLRAVYARTGDSDPVRDCIREAEARHALQSEAAGHPLVLTHPETGRRALFLGSRVQIIVGMTETESRPLLGFLQEHATSYEFTYRHRWSVGDVVLWDNRCLQHIALCDYDVEKSERLMIRCVLPRRTNR
jgi:taurine dioxygenase